MKNYAKVGNRTGRVAYRSASVFRYKKYTTIVRLKSKNSKNNRRRKQK